MPSKSPQRLAKLAKASAEKKPPLMVEYYSLEPNFPGLAAAAMSTVYELIDSKGFTRENAVISMNRYLFCFHLEALGMQKTLSQKDEAVRKMVGNIFQKHHQREINHIGCENV